MPKHDPSKTPPVPPSLTRVKTPNPNTNEIHQMLELALAKLRQATFRAEVLEGRINAALAERDRLLAALVEKSEGR